MAAGVRAMLAAESSEIAWSSRGARARPLKDNVVRTGVRIGRAPTDRTRCTQVSSMRGFQSYVELLRCLEMARDARKLPKDIT
jgi:hypothetical protein